MAERLTNLSPVTDD